MSMDALANLARYVPGPREGRRLNEVTWDVWLLFAVFMLVGVGIVMLYSASAVMASQKLGDHFYLVSSQLQKLVLGLILLLLGLKLDYRWYKRLIYPIFAGALIMLVLVLIPGVGVVQNGSRRWFSIMGMSFQPVEVAKVAAIMYLAYSVSKKGKQMGRFTVGFIPHLFMIGVMVALLLRQPDFGSSVILLLMMMIMLFISGAKASYLFVFSCTGALGAYYAITENAYRMKRIMAFLDPWSYRQNIGYQISESLIAIASGGVSGKGLGNGTSKLGYVPELWNDFIATIIAEELGLVGVLFVVSLFVIFIWRGYRVALHAQDAFGAYLAFGLTSLVALQATANLCVVTALLPSKGLTLPFVSFGGSSLIMALFTTGILLNISRHAPDVWVARTEQRMSERMAKRWDRKKRGILKRRVDLRTKFEQDDA